MRSSGRNGPVLVVGCASLPPASMSSFIFSIASVQDVLHAEPCVSWKWSPKRPPCDAPGWRAEICAIMEAGET